MAALVLRGAAPEDVKKHQRTAERAKPKLTKMLEAVHTPLKMLLACLPPGYLNGVVTFYNQRLADVDKYTCPATTKGEIAIKPSGRSPPPRSVR
eukprot:6185902-Pleurochrysis_carterae.AAC.1